MALGVQRLARIQLNSKNPEALAAFFVEALGFSHLDNLAGEIALGLGEGRLHLTQVGADARAYPDDAPSWSALFQHFAMITPDMIQSMARLHSFSGWRVISTDGPERLPAQSGGVTAFKFRDPEGHPLEFIEPVEPVGARPRIDHSAISVASTQRSIAFYQGLGLTVGAQTLNQGLEQARMDDVVNPTVEVTALEFPSRAAPHIELLSYRGVFPRTAVSAGPGDIAATRLILTVADDRALQAVRAAHPDRLLPGTSACLLRDPDGHILQIETAAAPPSPAAR